MEATDELVEVEVEFDYEAELGDELTIKAGEIIKDVKKMDGGWWEGSLNGRRGVFPDNFVKVLSKAQNSPKTKAKTVPSSTSTTTTTSASSEAVQLRRGQQSGRASANNKKKCRVLFSYQPKHDDELELKLDDVVEFLSEVEDGWWKGKLRGRVGVFPSNFVEMTKAAAASNTTTNTAEDDVADKNKRNEKLKVEKVQRPTSKISSLIQEAENKSKQRKSSTENLNLLKRESPLGGEDKKADDLVNAPKLPPKPVKEQCIVLFPYNAVNDDELSLEEGQLITIVSKDVEDKGWWKGEVDGRIGVFPDNFVKIVNASNTNSSVTSNTTSNTNVTSEDNMKSKKPSRPPSAKQTSNNKTHRKSETENLSSTNSSREKLNGSSDRLSTPLKKTAPIPFKTATPSNVSSAKTQPASLPPNPSPEKSTAKKHSFGKSTPPPKPKPPSFVSKGSSSSLNESKEVLKESPQPKIDNKLITEPSQDLDIVDLDQVLRSDDRLAHLTAERVKAPKRRPPSSVFQKEAKLSGDAFESFDATNEDETVELRHKRSASQGSLHNDNDHQFLSTTRQESKNRLSFKMVKQQMKEALGNLSSNGDRLSFAKDSKKAEKLASSPPSKPQPAPSAAIEAKETPQPEESAKKPEWLAELSRKQANRRSGLFTSEPTPNDANKTSSSSIGTSPPKTAEKENNNKPVIASDKPHIPLKPSQIRDEARKSAVFPKRPSSSENLINTSNTSLNDKENNKPTSGLTQKPPTSGLFSNKSEEKPRTIEPPKPVKKPSFTSNNEPAVTPESHKEPEVVKTEVIKPEVKPEVAKVTPEVPKARKSDNFTKFQQDLTTPPPAPSSKPVTTPEMPKPIPEVTKVTSAIGWKPSVLQSSSSVEETEDELSLEQRVKKLEIMVASMKTSYEAKFEALNKALEIERKARLTAEKELQKN